MSAKELHAIGAAYVAARQNGQSSALATVVKTSGSVYRRPGARMFVAADGRTAGSISGGCLEDDARERALEVIAAGQPELICYDTTAEGDILWGSGVGCTGVIHVLIEPLAGALAAPACIAQGFARRSPGILATLFQADGAPGLRLGSLLWWAGADTDAACAAADPALLAAAQAAGLIDGALS